MRFDVPTVGCSTIESIHQAGGKVLAIEAGKTIFLDQEKTLQLADQLGLTVVAVEDAGSGARARSVEREAPRDCCHRLVRLYSILMLSQW